MLSKMHKTAEIALLETLGILIIANIIIWGFLLHQI